MKILLYIGTLVLFFACKSNKKIVDRSTSPEHRAITYELIEENKIQRKQILYDAYQDLVLASTFRDSLNQVSEETLWKYKLLFQSSAKVWNDLASNPDQRNNVIAMPLYVDQVSGFMHKRGVKTEWKEYTMEDILSMEEEEFLPSIDRSDPDDDVFYYSLKTTKKNYCKLNKDMNVMYFDDPIVCDLLVTFRISINNESAEIVSILLDEPIAN